MEIAEDALVGEAQTAAGRLRALKNLGVGLEVDGFGSAHSSLSRLKRLPLDVLKLDGSLVAGLGEEPGGAAIVAAMIELAHALGWSVTAEEVETADQLARLRELGCDLAQGYHLCGLLTGEEASALLEVSTELIPPPRR